MQSTINHELLAPLKCVIVMVNDLRDSIKDLRTIDVLNSVAIACELLISQI
jgi:hypothetical protein